MLSEKISRLFDILRQKINPPVANNKNGAIYRLPDRQYIIVGNSPLKSGAYISTGPYIKITAGEFTPEVFVSRLKECIAGISTKKLPHPKDSESIQC